MTALRGGAKAGGAPGLAVLRPKTQADLLRAREAIAWVHDEDLDEIEPRSAAGAAALSFVTWGGGQLMAFDRWRGAGFISALVLLVVLVSALPFVPGVLFPILWALGGAVSAVDAYRRVRAVRRFLLTRTQLQLASPGNPSHYRLLASAAAVDPHLASALGVATAAAASPALGSPALTSPAGPRIEVTGNTPPRHSEVLEQLRKLFALRAAGIISETELLERKIDILAAIAPEDRASLDQLLYDLMPLADEGVPDTADFEFLKGASAGR